MFIQQTDEGSPSLWATDTCMDINDLRNSEYEFVRDDTYTSLSV